MADRWGTAVDFTTSFLHSLLYSAFGRKVFHSRPVHSLMLQGLATRMVYLYNISCLRYTILVRNSWLSSYHLLYLPLRLPPCRIVLASPVDRATCPYHFSLRLFTEVRRSSYGPMAFPILAFNVDCAQLFFSIFLPRQSCQCYLPVPKQFSGTSYLKRLVQ